MASACLRRLNQLDAVKTVHDPHELMPSIIECLSVDLKASQPHLSLKEMLELFTTLAILYGSRKDESVCDFAFRLWRKLNHEHETIIKYQKPKLLVQCLRAVLRLDIPMWQTLYVGTVKRLAQGDALSKLDPEDMALMLIGISQHELNPSSDAIALMIAFLRRLRKAKVRLLLEASTTYQLLEAMMHMARKYPSSHQLYREVQVCTYTIGRHACTFYPITTSTLPTLLRVAKYLKLSSDDPLLEGLNNVANTAAFLTSLETCQSSELFHLVHNFHLITSPDMTEAMVDRCITELQTCRDQAHVCSLLRFAVQSGNVVRFEPAKVFINAILTDPGFVKGMKSSHMSNVLWFLGASRHYDSEMYKTLTAHLLTNIEDFVDQPRQACRIFLSLGTLSSLGQHESAAESQLAMTTLRSVFVAFQPALINVTAKVAPGDIAGVLYSYSKVLPGEPCVIFDYLLEVLVDCLPQTSVRHISQVLWACGRVSIYNTNESAIVTYVKILIKELSGRISEVTVIDVVQSIWAASKVGVRPDDCSELRIIIAHAGLVSDCMSTREICTVVGSLARMRAREYDVIKRLTSRFKKACDPIPSPDEAASLIFSLGRLNMRDRVSMTYLGSVLLQNPAEINGQAVARVLWAYRKVQMNAPPSLLDHWAEEKLGLRPAAHYGT